jgi:hypothetical protein
MRPALIGFAALVAASAAGIASSSAQHWQGRGTWCTVPAMGGGGAWGCYYYSEAQCRATAYYDGRSCSPNPAADWARRGFQVPPELWPREAPRRR